MAHSEESRDSSRLRVIDTARTAESINEFVKEGFRPLIKKVVPSDQLHAYYEVFQNKKTNEIAVSADVRLSMDYEKDPDYKKVIEWSSFYPYFFSSPFAAYIIPPDIKVGERVYIEDLIEDYVDNEYQRSAYRLEGCEAIWTGSDFRILIKPRDYRNMPVG